MLKKYVVGSEGCRNMFFRAKDTKYKIEGVEGEFVASEDHWIIQWEGYPEYDSGYADYVFASEAEALESFQGD